MSWSVQRSGKVESLRKIVAQDFENAAVNCERIPSEAATVRAIATVVDAELAEYQPHQAVLVTANGSVYLQHRNFSVAVMPVSGWID